MAGPPKVVLERRGAVCNRLHRGIVGSEGA